MKFNELITDHWLVLVVIIKSYGCFSDKRQQRILNRPNNNTRQITEHHIQLFHVKIKCYLSFKRSQWSHQYWELSVLLGRAGPSCVISLFWSRLVSCRLNGLERTIEQRAADTRSCCTLSLRKVVTEWKLWPNIRFMCFLLCGVIIGEGIHQQTLTQYQSVAPHCCALLSRGSLPILSHVIDSWNKHERKREAG